MCITFSVTLRIVKTFDFNKLYNWEVVFVLLSFYICFPLKYIYINFTVYQQLEHLFLDKFNFDKIW